MTNQLIKKITLPKSHLKATDLTPEEKIKLYSLMSKYGASMSFSYDRFFKEGFDAWEIEGINNVLRRFCEEHHIAVVQTFDELPVGNGIRMALYEEMNRIGMCKAVTKRRFTANNWKPFERVGIQQIFTEFLNANN